MEINELANFTKEKKTINLLKANIYSVIAILPISFLYLLPYYILWRSFPHELFDLFSLYSNNIMFALFLLIGLLLHELIHGITWAIFAKDGFKSIKFGIFLKVLTPYCHCKEPLRLKYYLLGTIMPSIILGLIPAVLGIISGNILFLVFGIFFTIAAFGDFMVINLLKNESNDSYVLDHPSEVGYFVYRIKNNQ